MMMANLQACGMVAPSKLSLNKLRRTASAVGSRALMKLGGMSSAPGAPRDFIFLIAVLRSAMVNGLHDWCPTDLLLSILFASRFRERSFLLNVSLLTLA